MNNEKIIDKFEKLSNKEKIPILFEALEYMQQYNGRSVNDCIIYAMGYVPEGYSGFNREEP